MTEIKKDLIRKSGLEIIELMDFGPHSPYWVGNKTSSKSN
jgi:hypothetical protein